jgi:hypothetical protein
MWGSAEGNEAPAEKPTRSARRVWKHRGGDASAVQPAADGYCYPQTRAQEGGLEFMITGYPRLSNATGQTWLLLLGTQKSTRKR